MVSRVAISVKDKMGGRKLKVHRRCVTKTGRKHSYNKGVKLQHKQLEGVSVMDSLSLGMFQKRSGIIRNFSVAGQSNGFRDFSSSIIPHHSVLFSTYISSEFSWCPCKLNNSWNVRKEIYYLWIESYFPLTGIAIPKKNVDPKYIRKGTLMDLLGTRGNILLGPEQSVSWQLPLRKSGKGRAGPQDLPTLTYSTSQLIPKWVGWSHCS